MKPPTRHLALGSRRTLTVVTLVALIAAASPLHGSPEGALRPGMDAPTCSEHRADMSQEQIRAFEEKLAAAGLDGGPVTAAVPCPDICVEYRTACLLAAFSCGPFYALCAAVCWQNYANCLAGCP